MMETKPQLGLGEYLRGEREKRHITIEQVASATKINIKLLHALEGDNYDALPAKPFVRGFVTSYTRYVGLDHREVLARFDIFLDEKSGQKFKRPNDAPHIFVEREGQSENSKTWLSIAMVIFIVVGVLVFAILKPSLKHHRGRGKDKTTVTNEDIVTVVPPPTDSAPIMAAPLKPDTASQLPQGPQNAKPGNVELETAIKPEAAQTKTEAEPPVPVKPEPKAAEKPKPEPVVAERPQAKVAEKPKKPEPTAAAVAVAPAAAEKPAPVAGTSEKVKLPPIPNNEVKYRLVVRAIDDAWVKYQVDDRPLQQYTLKKDKVIFVRARSSIRFTSAKPTALEISYDNKEFRPYGNGAKTIIMPKDAESQYKAAPFVDPNPIYLSTPNH
ncbi:MAG: helix-turn-helix domain-containing protein [Deltaproteobacteria bacterium]|nr:helix-turn-helix domain-containing protein [Deltaproteobacteria bacterium]